MEPPHCIARCHDCDKKAELPGAEGKVWHLGRFPGGPICLPSARDFMSVTGEGFRFRCTDCTKAFETLNAVAAWMSSSRGGRSRDFRTEGWQ